VCCRSRQPPRLRILAPTTATMLKGEMLPYSRPTSSSNKETPRAALHTLANAGENAAAEGFDRSSHWFHCQAAPVTKEQLRLDQLDLPNLHAPAGGNHINTRIKQVPGYPAPLVPPRLALAKGG